MKNILEGLSGSVVLSLLAGSLVACGSSSPTISQASEASTSQSLESGTELIVGGELIGLRRAPWIVALVTPVDVGGTVVPELPACGGVLIASEWVLTAAHCFYDGEEFFLPSAVVVGREDFTVDDQGNYNVPEDGERLEIADVEFYPFFDIDRYNTWDAFIIDDQGMTERPPRSLGYADIALIKLASPVQTVTDFAILPTSYRIPVGATSTVFGWGLLAEDGPFADQLNFVNLPIVSNFTCSRAFGAPGLITFDLICAGPEEGGQDACGGDSGGPLVVVSEGRPEVVGIVNTGRGCARPGLYGVYTRVFPFIPWIDSVIEGEDASTARTEFSFEELSHAFSAN